MDKLKMAKIAYKDIVNVLCDLEDKWDVRCSLPEFIDVDGERFFKNELHELSIYNKEKGE